MSAIDVALSGTIAVIVGGLIIWFTFYTFSDQTKPPSNLSEETLKRLIGSTGRATAEVTESTGTVLVNSKKYSAKISKGDYPERTQSESCRNRWFDDVGRESVDWSLTATARVAAVIALVARPCPDHDHSTVLARGRVGLIVEARKRGYQIRSFVCPDLS